MPLLLTRRQLLAALGAAGVGRVWPTAADAAALHDAGEAVATAKPVIRVVGFGDFGYQKQGTGQKAVAAAIAARHTAAPYDFGITLGDNFYTRGVKSVKDKKWNEIWERIYSPLGIPFYAALGNHDYSGNVQAQVDYTKSSKTWRMPSRYYTFRAGSAQFFVLDTDEGTAGRLFMRKPWSDRQAQWLDAELGKSKAAWKIVYGHHPIRSDGHHGDGTRLIAKLLPVLRRHGVGLYLCGHEHDLQFHRYRDGSYELHLVVAGGGGKDVRGIEKKRAECAEGRHGFVELAVSAESLAWSLRGTQGEVLHGQRLEAR